MNTLDLDSDAVERLAPTPGPWWRFESVDRRVVGMTALIGVIDGLPMLLKGAWGPAVRHVIDAQLNGFLVVGLATLLLGLRRPALRRPLALALAVFAGCTIASVITHERYVGYYTFSGTAASAWTVIWFVARRNMLLWGTLTAAWYFVQRSAERRAALRASEIARFQLDAQLTEARLQTLEAQVEPHFLFNTLAHVRHLYAADPDLARRVLDSFCDYLVAALPQMRAGVATLGSELALAEAYLEVQKIRMGDRLVVDIDVDVNDRRQPFPPMMLASLVENAIKHGLNPLPEGGTIRVSTEPAGDVLRVVVADSGRGFSTSRGTGVGLANIRGRLAAVYGAAARMTLTPNAPRGIRAAIEIPRAGACEAANAA